MKDIWLEALEKSIKHWDCICQGLSVSMGADNCALCALADELLGSCNLCSGCPVKEHTGEFGCNATVFSKKMIKTVPQHAHLNGVQINDYMKMFLCLIECLPESHKWRELLDN